MTTKLEPKRRAGLPPREKPKPVSPALAGGHGKNRPLPGTVAPADDTDRWLEKLAAGADSPPRLGALARGPGPIEPPAAGGTEIAKPPGKRAITVHLAVGLIDPSPWQPRRDFPEEEIRDLAASIAAAGLVAPIAVRPKRGGHYELLAGGRRLRAVKSLGWEIIRAEIRECSDAEARAIALAENLQRKDLDPIEQARAMQAILDAGDVATQEELGQRLGMSQGQISNTLRLLKLPKPLQKWLISGEINVGQARAVLAYAEHPRLMTEIEKQIGGDLAKAAKATRFGGALPPAEEFGALIERAARKVGRELAEKGETRWDGKSGRSIPAYLPSEETAAALQIIEVVAFPGERPMRFALDGARYDALEAAHRKEQRARQGAKAEGKAGTAKGRKGERGNGKAAAKLSPAAQKRLEDAERKREAARRADQARLTARRVHAWRINRLREAIAEVLAEPAVRGADLDKRKVALWLLIAAEGWEMHGPAAYEHDREQAFREAFEASGKTWPAIAGLDAAAIAAGTPKLLSGLVWDPKEGPKIRIPDDVVLGMAAVCRVDLAALWKTDQKGPAGRAYFELHTREQFLELGKELGLYLQPGLDKAAMIRLFSDADKVLALPKELKKKGRGIRGKGN